MTSLDVLFTPADFSGLPRRDLTRATCVVFDVLRATSTIVTALANGAAAVCPVLDIPQALAEKARNPEVLLAGERNGVRIEALLTGSVPFDLGNSPREFGPTTVAGRKIVMTTTNGTRALQACARAQRVLACSFLNVGATAAHIRETKPAEVVIVCSGTHEESAYEDVLGAGALCDLIGQCYPSGAIADSALMARALFALAEKDLVAALSRSRNGRRLLTLPELREDIPYCAQRDKIALVVEMDGDGLLRSRSSSLRALG